MAKVLGLMVGKKYSAVPTKCNCCGNVIPPLEVYWVVSGSWRETHICSNCASNSDEAADKA